MHKNMQPSDFQGEKFQKFIQNYRKIDEKTGINRKITVEEASEILGVSRNQVYNYFKDDSLNDKVVANILSSFDVTIDEIWGAENPEGITRSEFLLKSDNRSPMQKVPLYDIQASAGLVQLFQSDKQTPIDWISIPNLPKSDGAIYVTGDSMYPLLKSGDIVIFKNVNDVKEGLFWGEMYIVAVDIDGDEMTTVKYIQKSDLGPDYVKLVSQNQYHAPKEIKLEHLKAAALVKASIRMNTII